MAYITKKEWKTESLEKFRDRYNKARKRIIERNAKYNNDKKLFFIPVNQLLTETIGVHTTHWMRDFMAKGVVDGEAKLDIILTDDAQMETETINEMLRNPNIAYAYSKLLNQYYNLREQNQDLSLDENEAVKDNIKLVLSPDTSFKVDINGNKD